MICGIDEAGRGPVLGPMIVCGIAVRSDEKLKALGVRDSKKLSPKRREELAPKIRRLAEVEVVELSADQIDAARRRMTMNELEARVFAAIIEKLSPDEAFVDAADVSETEFERMIRSSMKCTPKIVSKHKADDTYPVVSAASIVAKVVRDTRVREIELEIGAPIGSGYQTDEVTMNFLNEYVGRNGRCPPHTRRSWEPAKNIMMVNSLRTLDKFE
jgi:ribonuclease HII